LDDLQKKKCPIEDMLDFGQLFALLSEAISRHNLKKKRLESRNLTSSL